jgi:hypothetical protein
MYTQLPKLPTMQITPTVLGFRVRKVAASGNGLETMNMLLTGKTTGRKLNPLLKLGTEVRRSVWLTNIFILKKG